MEEAVAPYCKNRVLYFILHFISFALLYVPTGLSWYFGNMVVYLNSYWYTKHHVTKSASDWVISAYITTWGFGVILAGFIGKKVDRRVLTVIGIVLFEGGFFLTYITVDCSQILFIITMGAMTGSGLGFINTEVFIRLPALISKRAGLAMAILNNFFNVGGMLYVWLPTWYINPDNAEADVLVSGHFKVFSDKSVNAQIPDMFLVLGLVSSFFHISGLALTLLLKNKGLIYMIDVRSSNTKDFDCLDTESFDSKILTPNEKPLNQNNESKFSDSYEAILPSKTDHFDISKHCEDNSLRKITQFSKDERKNYEYSIQRTSDARKELDIESSNGDLSPSEVIRTSMFYVLWFTVFANDVTYIVLLNFYKIFGQLWIDDDHFLSQLGIVFLFVSFVMRTLWSFVVDALSPKTAQVGLTSLMAFTFFFYYFTPQVSQWLYAVWTCLGAGLCSSVYLTFSVTALKLFGKSHFAFNYGLVSTATVGCNIIAPSLMKFVYSNFGWSTIFLSTGVINALALVLIVAVLPNRPYLSLP